MDKINVFKPFLIYRKHLNFKSYLKIFIFSIKYKMLYYRHVEARNYS